jgi:spore germination protein GerM
MKIFKSKKNIIILCIILVAIFSVASAITFTIVNREKFFFIGNEYTPAEEISEEQERQTKIKLYYENIETGKLEAEERLIDVGVIEKRPYETLIGFLMENPENEKLKKIIPEGTKINSVLLKDNIVVIDFSKEFTENINLGAQKEGNIVYSIVNTLTSLIEVDGVRILVEGAENKAFADNQVNFKNTFLEIKEN